MPAPPASAPAKVLELVERFARNQDQYTRPSYNETQVRREFLDPLFKALGWDVDNEQGYAEAYKDVIHEDAIKVGRTTKAPDYSFRIGGRRVFFLEAKKPSLHLKDADEAAFQLRRYGWSAKLPLSLLSNFAELHVYDCRSKPVRGDKASHSRILVFAYEDYPDRWAELAGLFGKEAVLRGSLDAFAQARHVKKGTAAVDAAFLAEIERWRELLARNFALRNPGLSSRELNFAVQQTIDRIIFLRIAEDRGLEPYAQLQALLNGDRVYPRLFALFQQADDRYNSGLFHFQEEKCRSDDRDTLTPFLNLDDKILKDILKNLYYPDSPYEFSVLPADLLGQVYEQFLGKVIRLTPGHRAVVELKPEVRKAGGVYYTPTYIVDYIVRQTVGRLLAEKKISPRTALKLRVLDPACGSGSFLLGAYQYLLDWHLEQYRTDPNKWARGKQPRLYQAARGLWKLTINERKRILLDHIYGVDLDPQAVEVTKLSLLLKVLEGEDEQSMGQLKLFHERALPDLGRNIKCGNSLIGPDFFRGRLNLIPDDDLARLNPFDWPREFPEIMAAGGFDVVIGNPPYIRIQTMKEWAPLEVELYKEHYASARQGNYDIYVVFVERGLQLLHEQGRLGFILPHKFFNAQYGEPLRRLLSQGRCLADVVHFGDQQVFAGATTYTCLLFLNKSGTDTCRVSKVTDLNAWRRDGQAEAGAIPTASLGYGEWHFAIGRGADLFEKLRQMPVKLGDISHLFVGVQTDADDVYILEQLKINNENNLVLCKSKQTGIEHWFENVHLKPLLKGSLNIKRYFYKNLNKRLIFPYEIIDGKSVLINPEDYNKKYPLTWEYLIKNRKRLIERNKGKLGQNWYGYVYKKNHTRFSSPKILTPSIAKYSCFAFDNDGKYFFVGSGGGGGGAYGITLIDNNVNYLYVLGLLNSNLLNAFLKSIATPFRGGYFATNKQYLENLPIRLIDFTDPADAARHDRMVALVEEMQDLHQRLAAASLPQDRERLRRRIEATDQEIDALVYELYDLTPAEIALVEGR